MRTFVLFAMFLVMAQSTSSVGAGGLSDLRPGDPIQGKVFANTFQTICLAPAGGELEPRIGKATGMGFIKDQQGFANLFHWQSGRLTASIQTSPFSEKHTMCQLTMGVQDIVEATSLTGLIDDALGQIAPDVSRDPNRSGRQIAWDGKRDGKDLSVRLRKGSITLELIAAIEK